MTALTTRALVQAASLPAVLAGLLFLSAGAVAWWQGWVLIGVFATAVIAITLYLAKHDPALLQRRMQAGVTGEPERWQRILQGFAGLVFLLVFVLPGLDHRWHWSTVPTALCLLGDVGVAVAFYAIFRVFRANTFTSSVVEVAEGQQVITTGPYRLVRHPMYAAALLLFVAMPLALGSFWGLLTVPPLTLVLVLRLLDEERLLRDGLPGYAAYCGATRYRLVPYLW